MEYIILLVIILGLGLLFFRDSIFPKEKKHYDIDDQYNSDRREREKEIDSLLSKIGKNGVDDLTEKERKRLDELSKRL